VGYWRKEDLTKSAFLPDPKGGNDRIYKTGDLGFMLPDGCLFHLGRKDLQVKIRGYRVEVTEIEMALNEIAEIKEAVVVGREDRYGGKFLIAYVVPHKGKVLKIGELRDFLKNKLPDYMIPSRFIFLDTLPITSNGKVDRNALPVPAFSRHHIDGPYVAPRDSIEEKLAKIWAAILGIKQIGIKDNFFYLGGDSLLATGLLIEIKKVTGRDLPVRSLFEFPTIEQLAAVVRDKNYAISPSPLVAIQPHGTKAPFFWVYGGTDKALLGRNLGSDQPLYGVMSPALDGRSTIHKSIEEMAADYLREIRAVQSDGPYLLGGYCFGGAVCIEMAQQLLKQGQKVSLLFIIDPPRLCLPPAGSTLGARSRNSLSHSEISRHLHGLIPLRFVDKLTYVLNRIRRIAVLSRKSLKRTRKKVMSRRGVKRIKKRLGMIICKTYFGTGLPLPQKLRTFYVREVHYRALRSYVPRVYPGHMTVILSGEDSSRLDLDWSRLAAEGVTRLIIPGARHNGILRAPYVEALAEHLRFCLIEAQTARVNR
jgi:acyl carrier protein